MATLRLAKRNFHFIFATQKRFSPATQLFFFAFFAPQKKKDFLERIEKFTKMRRFIINDRFHVRWGAGLLLSAPWWICLVLCGSIMFANGEPEAYFERRGRVLRQLQGGPGQNLPEVIVQVTAELFSGRLYEFGPNEGDSQLPAGVDVGKKVSLRFPITFYGQKHDSVYVSDRQNQF